MTSMDGKSVYYLDPNSGGAPAVLLLHGLGADSESWGYQFPALIQAGLRPIAPDLPGFGRSPAMEGERWTVQAAARRMMALLDRLDIPTVDVVGLSLGGTVAQQVVLDYPARVRKLVLVSTFACLRPRRLHEWVYLGRRFVVANVRGVRAQAEVVAWRVFPHAGQETLRQMLVQKIAQSDPHAYRAAMREIALFDTRRRLAGFRLPTLVVTGSEDDTVPLPVQKILATRIPGARWVMIPEGRHGVNVDHPQEFNQALLDFLLAP